LRGKPGTAGAVALLAALGGTLLWLTVAAGPWRLATGLLEGGTALEKAEKSLATGARKAARYETLIAAAAIDRAGAGWEASRPLLALAHLSPAARAALGEGQHVVDAAEFSARAALGTLDIAENALTGPEKVVVREAKNDPQSNAHIRLDRIAEIGELVTEIRRDVTRAARALGAVEISNIPGRFRPEIKTGLDRARSTIRLLGRAEAGFELLPAILGSEGTRTYLLAMQNSAELRGTGGAMLRFADLQFTEGAAELLPGQSVYKIDQDRQQLSIPLPEDAWYVAGIDDAKRFGNANWSPDWPLTSRLTLRYRGAADELHEELQLEPIDGVIGVDPITMSELLKGAGRIETAGGRPITPDKVLPYLLYKAYAQFPNPGERRSNLREVVDLFYARVLKPERPSDLVRVIGRSLETKHIQIWMADPREQAFVRRMDWDGGVAKAERANYLYVVQQNVGGNKLNYFEEQTHSMDVVIDGDDAEVETEIKVRNGVMLPAPRYVAGDSMGFHRPMINVYVPRTARVMSAYVAGGTRLDLAAEGTSAWPGPGRPAEHLELGKKVWSATLEIEPLAEASLRYEYRVPNVVRTRGDRYVYRVVIQRQPKIRPEQLRLTLRLPSGAGDVEAHGWKKRDGVLVWERRLRSDRVLEVSWAM
jgi:hypothetical protein